MKSAVAKLKLAATNDPNTKTKAPSMKDFLTISAALHFVVTSLIPRRHSYILEMRGPDGLNAGQFIDERRVFGGPACGLTLHLAFGGSSRTIKELRFLSSRQYCRFEVVTRSGCRCYAAKFGKNVQTAARVHWAVASSVYYNGDSMQFVTRVFDEGRQSACDSFSGT